MEYKMGVQLADDGLDKRRKKSAIRRNAIKFTKIVSLVGIRHATDTNNSAPRRFVWVAWLVLGFGLAIYQIQDRIVYYYRYPSVTVFREIIEDEMLLPQITICNDNEIVTTKAKDLGFQDYSDELKKLEAKKQNDSSGSQNATIAMNLVLEKFHNFSKDWEILSKNLTLTAKEAIVAVTFDEIENRTLIEEVVTDHKHCFAFSTKKLPLKSTRAGPSGGLFLVLSVARKEYANDKKFEPGYRMLIHDSADIPRMKEGGYPLKPGVVTRVAVSLEEVRQLGAPYGNCFEDESGDYNEENCLAKSDCIRFTNQCGCAPLDAKTLGCENASDAEVPVCSYANIYNCTVVKKESFLNTSNADPEALAAIALCNRRQCNKRLYTIKDTTSAFPLVMNEPSTNVQADSQILDRIRVYVFYEYLTYTEAHNEPEYLFLDLLIDIGGALSLLLGATLLTVYEAGEFMLLFARDYLHLRLAK